MKAVIINLVLYLVYLLFAMQLVFPTFEAATLFFIAVLEIPIFASVILRRLKNIAEPREQPAPPPAAEETAEETDE